MKKIVTNCAFVALLLFAWKLLLSTDPSSTSGTKRSLRKFASGAEIKSSVRVLCFVITCDAHLASRTVSVKNTWGPRCDKILYISDKENSTFPAISPPGIDPGYQALWSKTMTSFRFIYKHYLKEYHWFMKADDDTYVVMENLKYFLAKHNPEEPHYFGKHFKTLGGYTSGGAGYVLSREALRQLEDVFVNQREPDKCRIEDKIGAEDANLGICLSVAGIHPGDTLDSAGKDVFHSFIPDWEVMGDMYPDWYFTSSKNPPQAGCSDDSISFHYITPRLMKLLDYLIYNLGALGLKEKQMYPIHPYYLS